MLDLSMDKKLSEKNKNKSVLDCNMDLTIFL